MNTKKIIKVAGYTLVGAAAIVTTGALAYIYCHKPDVVSEPCFRSLHRADGRPKKAFDTPQKANLQSVKQFVKYGEVCNSYQVDDKYYTGHSKNAFCRNIYHYIGQTVSCLL